MMGRWLLVALATLIGGCISALPQGLPEMHDRDGARPVEAGDAVRVMTINLAHGRGNGFHQAFQSAATTKDNLARVAEFLRANDPHVVALQEADAPSSWSGNFDHVAWLATQADYPWATHGTHAEGMGLEYGTAVLSRLAKIDRGTYTFPGALAATPKGYTQATVRGPGGRALDVVSIHLHPVGRGRREAQLETLAEVFSSRSRPLVIMGDFNTEWEGGRSELAVFAETMGLEAWLPEATDLDTYPRMGRRLDWILISEELEFVESRVHDEVLSDHKAVSAKIRLRDARPNRARTFVDYRGLPVIP